MAIAAFILNDDPLFNHGEFDILKAASVRSLKAGKGSAECMR
ncbi:hypothetical protein [Nitrosospira lacus]|nr:hypothetical protein [Nitrosospira lacus]